MQFFLILCVFWGILGIIWYFLGGWAALIFFVIALVLFLWGLSQGEEHSDYG